MRIYKLHTRNFGTHSPLALCYTAGWDGALRIFRKRFPYIEITPDMVRPYRGPAMALRGPYHAS